MAVDVSHSLMGVERRAIIGILSFVKIDGSVAHIIDEFVVDHNLGTGSLLSGLLFYL